MSRLGIVTVTYNSAAVLPEFLESVWKQTHDDFLLYLIDSGSTDETEDRLREIADPRVRTLIQKENIGFAAGSNFGIQMALEDGCEAVMLLNNDTAFGPNLFERMFDGLDAHRCDMAAPKILYYNTPAKIWAAGGRLNPWLGYRQSHDGANQPDDGRFDHPHRITFAPFCCFLIRKDVFSRIGLLDEAYFVYVEDVDYCYRAWKANLSICYLPNSQVLHKVSSLTGHMSDFMIEQCTRNRMYYLRKHFSWWQARFWYAFYRVYFAMDFLSGKSSRNRWNLRRRAARAGWRMVVEAANRERSSVLEH